MTAYYKRPFANRAEWLAWRREGIGGSDVAAIAGLSTFASPMSTYLDKLDLRPEAEPHEAMLWGSILEPTIGTEFENRTGLWIVEPQVLTWDPEKPWRRATLDGLVVESPSAFADAVEQVTTGEAELIDLADTFPLGVAEIKTTRDREWETIPDRVACQIQWALGITGLTHAWLPVLHAGQRLAIHELDFDPAAYDALARIVDRFWHDNVLAENPPAVDGTNATTEALKAAYPQHDDSTFVVLDDGHPARDALAQLPDVKVQLKTLEAEKAELENVVRVALGDSEAARDADGNELVTWKTQTRKAYTVEESEVRVLRPKKVKA